VHTLTPVIVETVLFMYIA